MPKIPKFHRKSGTIIISLPAFDFGRCCSAFGCRELFHFTLLRAQQQIGIDFDYCKQYTRVIVTIKKKKKNENVELLAIKIDCMAISERLWSLRRALSRQNDRNRSNIIYIFVADTRWFVCSLCFTDCSSFLMRNSWLKIIIFRLFLRARALFSLLLISYLVAIARKCSVNSVSGLFFISKI